MGPLHGSEPLSVGRSPEPLFDAGTEVSTVSLCVNDHPGDVSSVEGGCLGSVVSLGVPFPFSEVKFNVEDSFEFLEPLFSDFPSVAHNYTFKLNMADYMLGYKISSDLYEKGNALLFWEGEGLDSSFSVKPYPGSLSHLLSSRVVSDFGVVAGDVTLLTREFDTYSHLLRFVSARSTRLRCLRDAAVTL